MARFALAARVYIIVPKLRYSCVLASIATLRALDVDWSVVDCPVWYSCGYRTVDMHEVPPKQHAGRSFPGSKLWAQKGLKYRV